MAAGCWSKATRLVLKYNDPLPQSVIDSVPDIAGKKMQPLVAVTGHPNFNGLWRIVSVNATGTQVDAAVPYFDGDTYEPWPWDLFLPPDEGANICLRQRPNAKTTPMLVLAPPLNFHSRCTLVHLDNIDLVAQNFRADVYIELRLRALSMSSNRRRS